MGATQNVKNSKRCKRKVPAGHPCVFVMRKITLIIPALILMISLSIATTTTQLSKTDILKAEWNRTICIALHVLQILSVGIAALLIMVAGLKYMSSEDVYDRDEAKNMIIRVLSVLVIIAVVAQVVNYLVAGTRVGSVDMDSCNDLFPTTTQGGGPTTAPTTTTTTTTIGNGTTTTVVTTTSSTTTTTPSSCTDASSEYSIYGSKNICQRASDPQMPSCANQDLDNNGVKDIDEVPGLTGPGYRLCCCKKGFSKCCLPGE